MTTKEKLLALLDYSLEKNPSTIQVYDGGDYCTVFIGNGFLSNDNPSIDIKTYRDEDNNVLPYITFGSFYEKITEEEFKTLKVKYKSALHSYEEKKKQQAAEESIEKINSLFEKIIS